MEAPLARMVNLARTFEGLRTCNLSFTVKEKARVFNRTELDGHNLVDHGGGPCIKNCC